MLSPVGFISAPARVDPAVSELPTVVEEKVQTQQDPHLLPNFDYRLERIVSVQDEQNLCAQSLKTRGVISLHRSAALLLGPVLPVSQRPAQEAKSWLIPQKYHP